MLFFYCKSLGTLTVEDGVIGIEMLAFLGCESLTSLSLPGSLKNIGNLAFKDCVRLAHVELPDGLEHIGVIAFEGCTALTDVTLPASVSSVGDGAFALCKNLSCVTVDPQSQSLYSIDSVLFHRSEHALLHYPILKADLSYNVPDGVITVFSKSFEDNKSLEELYIPASVKYIESKAFYGCDSLKKVYYAGSFEDWNKIFIGIENKKLTESNIFYNYKVPCKRHTLTPIAARKATCTTVGYKAYYRCTACKVFFTAAKKATTWAALKMVATGHKYKNGVCTVCKNRQYKSIAPELVSSSNTEYGTLLSWGKIPGATGYIVYHRTAGKGFSALATVSHATLKFYDKKAVGGVAYIYTVRAIRGKINGAYNKTGLAIKVLSAPTLKAVCVKTGVNVTYSKVAGATFYIVYRKTGTGAYKAIKALTALKYLDKTAGAYKVKGITEKK